MGILGVILGIVAVACAVLATALFGTTGCIITVVVAVVAALLGVLKRKKDRKGGIAAIVIAVLTVHDKAVELMPDGLWAQASEDNKHGLMGIISKLPTDDASLNKLVEEMNALNKMVDAQ